VPCSNWLVSGAASMTPITPSVNQSTRFRVNPEAERIQQLALLHEPEQNRLSELS
jgi:hypothetical protein